MWHGPVPTAPCFYLDKGFWSGLGGAEEDSGGATPSHPLAPLLGPGPKEVAAGPLKGLKGARESERAEQCGQCLRAGSYKTWEEAPKSHLILALEK